MLLTIGAILFGLWLLGVILKFTFGGLIHIFLIIAIVVFIYRMLTGRKPPI